MKKSLSERTKQLLADLEINQVELAAIAKCTKGAVNQWIKNDNPDSTMNAECAFNISDNTDYEVRWLMLGEGPEKKQRQDIREKALIDLYRASDERGRDTILRTAESQSTYEVERDDLKKRSA